MPCGKSNVLFNTSVNSWEIYNFMDTLTLFAWVPIPAIFWLFLYLFPVFDLSMKFSTFP